MPPPPFCNCVQIAVGFATLFFRKEQFHRWWLCHSPVHREPRKRCVCVCVFRYRLIQVYLFIWHDEIVILQAQSLLSFFRNQRHGNGGRGWGKFCHLCTSVYLSVCSLIYLWRKKKEKEIHDFFGNSFLSSYLFLHMFIVVWVGDGVGTWQTNNLIYFWIFIIIKACHINIIHILPSLKYSKY